MAAVRDPFQFSATLLPYPLFYLTHIVAVCGIHSGAFKAGYKSVEELLHRPNLEDVDYVPLEWNDNMADEDIFPMSYTTFSRILHQVLLVARFSLLTRVYAFRVGAGIDAVSSIPGVSIFDSQEGPAQKKARSFQEESSSRMKLDSPSFLAAPILDKPLLQLPPSRGPLLRSKKGRAITASFGQLRAWKGLEAYDAAL
ncbi:hypothetical protein F4823DRAFT_563275 [Ustulina deusta]|nr:hypothetical protein F4823DRAFT_563275 [Ustulina deusta]